MMVAIQWRPVHAAAYVLKSSLLCTLLRCVMVGLTQRLQVTFIKEQILISLMRDHMVNDGRCLNQPLHRTHPTQWFVLQLIPPHSLPPFLMVKVSPRSGVQSFAPIDQWIASLSESFVLCVVYSLHMPWVTGPLQVEKCCNPSATKAAANW